MTKYKTTKFGVFYSGKLPTGGWGLLYQSYAWSRDTKIRIV